MPSHNIAELEHVVIKFAGDSGDGMQLTGTQFTDTSALLGNDIATFPDFPAEIRAPQGTLAGVSGFQVHIGKIKIYTPGDAADVLVAMNPAALKTNLAMVKPAGTIILNTNSFGKKEYERAHYESNPIEDGTLKGYNVVEAPISSLTRDALQGSGLDGKSIARCKNMFALGMVYWLFSRPLEQTERFIEAKFKENELLIEGNKKVLRVGYNYAETIEALSSSYTILPAKLDAGVYRNIMGNEATAWGFLAASERSGRPLFLGSYPITPASNILHELSKHKHFGVKVMQAEDEIAAVCIAIGASFGGSLGITTTSGPGLALKSEAIGLAMIAELPLVVVNVQRGGPSTGLPTKTEQADLLQALYGRNGESPVVVIAASTPSNCFDYAYQASKIALEHMTPVILLTDGYLANGSEPWKIKKTEQLSDIDPPILDKDEKDWYPYIRDQETLVRHWALPGIENLEHRIGGLEKDFITGNVSYDPENHERMCRVREDKVQKIADVIPELQVEGSDGGELLIVGWGGTYGALANAVDRLTTSGKSVSLAQFNYIKPLPKNTADVFSRFKTIVVCELNLGQFSKYLRSTLPQFKYEEYHKIQGMPFTVAELCTHFEKILTK